MPPDSKATSRVAHSTKRLGRAAKRAIQLDGKRAEAQQRFADAERQLADAQAEIDAIADKDASVYVLDRSKNLGAESFRSDAGRIDQIAAVFPLMFFLVAAFGLADHHDPHGGGGAGAHRHVTRRWAIQMRASRRNTFIYAVVAIGRGRGRGHRRCFPSSCRGSS